MYHCDYIQMTLPIYCNTTVNTSAYPYFMSYVCHRHSTRLLSSPSYTYENPKLLQIFWVFAIKKTEIFSPLILEKFSFPLFGFVSHMKRAVLRHFISMAYL